MDRTQIKLWTLEGLLEDIEGMNPEYITEYIKEQIDLIKYGI